MPPPNTPVLLLCLAALGSCGPGLSRDGRPAERLAPGVERIVPRGAIPAIFEPR